VCSRIASYIRRKLFTNSHSAHRPRAARPEPGEATTRRLSRSPPLPRYADSMVERRRLVVRQPCPGPHAAALVAGVALTPRGYDRNRAVGIDDDGMLDWVELAPEIHPDARSAVALGDLLSRLGCTAGVAVAGDGHALISGNSDVSGERPAPRRPSPSVSFERARRMPTGSSKTLPSFRSTYGNRCRQNESVYLAKARGISNPHRKRGSPPPEADAGDEVNSQESNQ